MTDEVKKQEASRTPEEQHRRLPEWVLQHPAMRTVLETQSPGPWASGARAKLLEAMRKREHEAPPAARNLQLTDVEQDRRDTVRRVLQALFSNTKPENAVRFRKAMERSMAEAEAVLTSFNVENGQALGNPKFNPDQYLGLSEIFFIEQFTPLAPVEEDGIHVKRQVLHFWTELLSRQTAQVEDFHLRVSDYAADRNDTGKREWVLETLRQYAPEGTWTREHVDALAEINTESIQFKSLAWLHFPGVIW